MKPELKKYLEEYGFKGLGLLVGKFIAEAPEFEGDKALARELGKAIADLETALRAEAAQ